MSKPFFNSYGNPHLKYNDSGRNSEFHARMDSIEKDILLIAIPELDKLALDDLVGVVSYMSSNEASLFHDYLFSRDRYRGVSQHQAAIRVVAKRLARRMRKCIHQGIYEYLDTLDYQEALFATSYIGSNIGSVFVTYVLARQMLASGEFNDRPQTVAKARELLASQRIRIGMQPEPLVDELIRDVASFMDRHTSEALDQRERDAGMDGSRYDD